MKRKPSPLTDRDLETLGELEAANRNLAKFGKLWVRVMDCGGSNGSHHGSTMAKLHERGLCDRHSYGHQRQTHLYRINKDGLATLIERWLKRRRA